MNERIKQLAEQAGLLSKQLGPSVETRHMKKKEQELGKFAELIVREAARFLSVNSGYDECDNAWFPEPEDMLAHFGVEE